MTKTLLQRGLGLSEQAATLFTELVGKYRKYLLVSFVASFASALMEGGTLAFLALAMELLGSGELSGMATRMAAIGSQLGLDRAGTFLLLVGAAVFAQVLHSVLHFIADATHASLQAAVESTARERIFDRFMTMSYADARKRRVGDLSSYMDQVNFLGLALQRIHMIVSQLLLLVVYMALLLWFSWIATAVTVIAMFGLTFLVRLLVRRVSKEAHDFKGTLVDVSQQTVEFLNGLRVILSFGREDYARQRIGTAIDNCARARRRGLI